MSGQPQKFAFDTEFGASGEVTFAPPRRKRSYTPEEVEEIRQAARAEGERTALASITAQQTAALSEIARACSQALPRLAAVAHEHRVAAASLALACGRAIADAALDRLPAAQLQAAFESLAREIEAAPKLIVSAAPELAESVQELLRQSAQNIGFGGAIQVRADGAMGRHAFILDFGDGSAAFDPAAAAARVKQTLEAALAAEGLHAEPLIPGVES